MQVCAILDNSLRMITAGGEDVHCNMENTVKVIDELVEEYGDICFLRKLITDHESEHGAHRIDSMRLQDWYGFIIFNDITIYRFIL